MNEKQTKTVTRLQSIKADVQDTLTLIHSWSSEYARGEYLITDLYERARELRSAAESLEDLAAEVLPAGRMCSKRVWDLADKTFHRKTERRLADGKTIKTERKVV